MTNTRMARVEDSVPTPEFQAANDFLHTVFSGQESGNLVLFRKPDNSSHFSPLSDASWAHHAAGCAMQLRDYGNVYFAIGVQGTLPDKGRGKETGVIALSGFWADIDVLGPNHAALALPPTLEDATRIAQAAPFKPTLIVYTGGGIQAYWLFKEPWEFETERDRKKAKALSNSLGMGIE